MPTKNSLKEINVYKYKMHDLIVAFKDAGFPISSRWVYRQEKKGTLVLPRSTTDVKYLGHGIKSKGAVRLFTKLQIKEIVKAFLPGGCGYWYFGGGVKNG